MKRAELARNLAAGVAASASYLILHSLVIDAAKETSARLNAVIEAPRPQTNNPASIAFFYSGKAMALNGITPVRLSSADLK